MSRVWGKNLLKERGNYIRFVIKIVDPFADRLCYGNYYLGVPKSDPNFSNYPLVEVLNSTIDHSKSQIIEEAVVQMIIA